MTAEKIKKDFRDIGNKSNMITIVLLSARIRELKKYIEKKIEVTDKWNVYAGECNAYKDILEKLNKLMKYV